MRCSFCWEDINDGKIVASGKATICYNCIKKALEILKEEKREKEEKP